jgi:MFS family permease
MTQYYICRFLVALGVGGEFAAGASLVAEAWPQRSRPMALGTLQALSAVGNVAAAFTTLAMKDMSWRYVYFIGALPALLLVFIQKGVHEPEQWQTAKAHAASTGQAMGGILALFEDPVWRRNTIAGVLLAGAGVGGLWGVAFFSVDFIGTILKDSGLAPGEVQKWKSIMSIVQQVGAGIGMFTFAIAAEKLGRRRSLFIFFSLAFISLQMFFHLTKDIQTAALLAFPLGFCTLGPFAAFAIYFPELYPTRLRSTGVGFCYNSARILAAAAPFALGRFAQHFAVESDPTAGFRTAATIVSFIYVLGFIGLIFAPETKGKPLPE